MIIDFQKSNPVTIGVELELQIIDSKDYSLAPRAKELLANLQPINYGHRIKSEITQGMIEINSSVHDTPSTLQTELFELQSLLKQGSRDMEIDFCGGGTHPFQRWAAQKIYPSKRYKKISHQFRYLCKRATVFGQHIHVGCESGDDAIFLTHAFARYIPQFIALSASSPFSQELDTGFCSTRTSIFSGFPTNGIMPFFINWDDFSNYFCKMKNWGVIQSLKDIYWDIRPQPKFGTVEIRIFDTPLTIKKSVLLAAYVQSLAFYLLQEKPRFISQDLFFLYEYNRFQASRYGMNGTFIDSCWNSSFPIHQDVLSTIDTIFQYSQHLGTIEYIEELKEIILQKQTDVHYLKNAYRKNNKFQDVVAEQCKMWNQNEYY